MEQKDKLEKILNVHTEYLKEIFDLALEDVKEETLKLLFSSTFTATLNKLKKDVILFYMAEQKKENN